MDISEKVRLGTLSLNPPRLPKGHISAATASLRPLSPPLPFPIPLLHLPTIASSLSVPPHFCPPLPSPSHPFCFLLSLPSLFSILLPLGPLSSSPLHHSSVPFIPVPLLCLCSLLIFPSPSPFLPYSIPLLPFFLPLPLLSSPRLYSLRTWLCSLPFFPSPPPFFSSSHSLPLVRATPVKVFLPHA